MKQIISMLLLVALTLMLEAQKNAGIEQTTNATPTFTVVASAVGDPADGIKSFRGVKIPKSVKTVLTPPAWMSKIEVQILKFDFGNVPLEKRIDKLQRADRRRRPDR